MITRNQKQAIAVSFSFVKLFWETCNIPPPHPSSESSSDVYPFIDHYWAAVHARKETLEGIPGKLFPVFLGSAKWINSESIAPLGGPVFERSFALFPVHANICALKVELKGLCLSSISVDFNRIVAMWLRNFTYLFFVYSFIARPRSFGRKNTQITSKAKHEKNNTCR